MNNSINPLPIPTLKSDNTNPTPTFDPVPTIDQVQFMNSLSSETFPPKEDVIDVDTESKNGGGVLNKPVWKKPSNGATMEVVGAVMGADSWPALSELPPRGSPKSYSTDSFKASVKEPAQVSQVTTTGSQNEVTTVVPIPAPIPNHVGHTNQRSIKRGGSSSHNNISPAPTMQGIAFEKPKTYHLSTKKPGASVVESSRDNTHMEAGQRRVSYSGNEQPHRNSFRRNNNGPQFNRRDPERENHDFHPNFGNRENHGFSKRGGTRPFPRGSSPNGPFIPSYLPSQTFVQPMVYPEHPHYMHGIHQNPFRPVHVAAFTPMLFPTIPDLHLQNMILGQIDYYFSNDNLVRDTYLRKNMDAEGWVPIKLIAGFKKVVELSNNNIQLILDSIKTSNVIEVQGDKVRRRGDWAKWKLPAVSNSNVASLQ